MPGIELEGALDDLFSEPPEAFVATRTALVRSLKAAGQAAEAERIKGWRRPSRPVWALNHLALSGDDTIAQLVTATTRAEELQSSGAPGLREAIAELRRAAHQTTSAAVEAISSARPADRAEISGALLAIVADPAAIELLAKGRLLEVPDTATGAFGSATNDRASSDQRETRRPRDRPKQGRAAEPGRALAKAKSVVTSAEKEHGRAVAEVAAADDSLEEASTRLRQAQSALSDAEADAESAAAEAEAARSKASAAAEALQEAQADLAALVE